MHQKATKRLGILINCNNKFSPIPETYPHGCGKLGTLTRNLSTGLWKTRNSCCGKLYYKNKKTIKATCHMPL